MIYPYQDNQLSVLGFNLEYSVTQRMNDGQACAWSMVLPSSSYHVCDGIAVCYIQPLIITSVIDVIEIDATLRV